MFRVKRTKRGYYLTTSYKGVSLDNILVLNALEITYDELHAKYQEYGAEINSEDENYYFKDKETTAKFLREYIEPKLIMATLNVGHF